MDKSEFSNVVRLLRENYRQWHLLETTESIELWYRMLLDIDYKTLSTVAFQYIATNKYPPTIADIRELCANACDNSIRTDWSEAWQQVQSLIRSCGIYRPQDAYEQMSELTKTTVKRLGWDKLCASENVTADRARFQTIYDSLKKQKINSMQIPKFVHEQLSNIEQLRLADGS